jgi:hypothetical protein
LFPSWKIELCTGKSGRSSTNGNAAASGTHHLEDAKHRAANCSESWQGTDVLVVTLVAVSSLIRYDNPHAPFHAIYGDATSIDGRLWFDLQQFCRLALVIPHTTSDRFNVLHSRPVETSEARENL